MENAEFRVKKDTDPGDLSNAILHSLQAKRPITLVGIGAGTVYIMTKAMIYANQNLEAWGSVLQGWMLPAFADGDDENTVCVTVDIEFRKQEPKVD